MEKKKVILKQAKRLFAKNGYDGTTMDEIASQSNANKALIYYHFKSKENLYSCILKDSVNAIYDYLINKRGESDNPKEALKIYIEAFFVQAKKDETFIRILMREIASDGIHMSDEIMERFLCVLKILDNIIKQGVNEGVFVERDAKMVHFIVIGAISYYLSSCLLRKKLSKKFPSNEFLLRDVENVPLELYEIILKGLKSYG